MAGGAHAVDLAKRLIRCPSVTPAEGGALDLLEAELSAIGFACTRLPFGESSTRIDNLFARYGDTSPHLCFAGHTDVVPAGDAAAWQHDPFGGTVVEGKLFGRGAADMKGGVAAFVAAAAVAVFCRRSHLRRCVISATDHTRTMQHSNGPFRSLPAAARRVKRCPRLRRA